MDIFIKWQEKGQVIFYRMWVGNLFCKVFAVHIGRAWLTFDNVSTPSPLSQHSLWIILGVASTTWMSTFAKLYEDKAYYQELEKSKMWYKWVGLLYTIIYKTVLGTLEFLINMMFLINAMLLNKESYHHVFYVLLFTS